MNLLFDKKGRRLVEVPGWLLRPWVIIPIAIAVCAVLVFGLRLLFMAVH
jgi:hypothetical protein